MASLPLGQLPTPVIRGESLGEQEEMTLGEEVTKGDEVILGGGEEQTGFFRDEYSLAGLRLYVEGSFNTGFFLSHLPVEYLFGLVEASLELDVKSSDKISLDVSMLLQSASLPASSLSSITPTR